MNKKCYGYVETNRVILYSNNKKDRESEKKMKKNWVGRDAHEKENLNKRIRFILPCSYTIFFVFYISSRYLIRMECRIIFKHYREKRTLHGRQSKMSSYLHFYRFRSYILENDHLDISYFWAKRVYMFFVCSAQFFSFFLCYFGFE